MEKQNINQPELMWFGNLPFYWKFIPLKFILNKIYTGGTPTTTIKEYWSDDETGINWVAISDISKSNGLLKETTKRITNKGLESKNLEIIPKGTMLLSIFASLGKVTILDIDATVNQAIIGISPNYLLEDKFLKYLFVDCERYISFFSSANTQENLNVTKIKDLVFPIPPLDTQKNIVSFLDKKTAEIDNIIEKKETLLLRLEEKKKAIINEAVTKGLNPNPILKDSGVEWINQIPLHWELVQLKYLSEKVGSGVTPKGGADVYTDDGVKFIRSQNVYFEGLRLDDVVFISEITHHKMENSKVLLNDVLLNITGGSIGRSCVVEVEEELNVNQHVCIIRPNELILSKFLNYLLYSDFGQKQIRLGITGGNREGLNFENIKNFYFPRITINEQKEIINFLDDRLQEFNNLNNKISSQIDKLKEYRQALISEAVTGKLEI